jgi:serine/threonine protein phosphatase 1
MRWIIGDIHGMLSPLENLLRAIDVADDEAELLFLGDYVNRGPASADVVETLLALPEARFIRGNHDDVFDLVLNRECYCVHASAPNPLMAMRWFLEHGLDKTLLSYGADPELIERYIEKPNEKLIPELTAGVPENHRKFFRQLPPVIDEHDFFMAHATWPTDERTELPGLSTRVKSGSGLRHAALWGRFTDEEIGRRKAWRRTGFFGHTPVSNYVAAARTGMELPLVGPQIVLLDTGCALSSSGRLTGFCVETRTYIQTDHFGKLVDD